MASGGRLMDQSVLVVKNDRSVCERLAEHLGRSGFRVRWATSLVQAEALVFEAFGLLVVDAHLPDGDGLDFGQRLRCYMGCGVIVCVGKEDKALHIAALRGGADACLRAPVDPDELEATLISVHRCLHSPAPNPLPVLVPSPWMLDNRQLMLRAPNGRSVVTNPLENRLLLTLFSHPDRRVDRISLVARLAEAAPGYTEARLEALVSRLRAKVVKKCGLRLPLVSSYGHGYRFDGYVRLM
ncbi:MAG: response regulator transcription factor [Zoogloea sp.]|nr:response regulator transcription factor [Zoogloea sp.]